jgi:hypothetical protein
LGEFYFLIIQAYFSGLVLRNSDLRNSGLNIIMKKLDANNLLFKKKETKRSQDGI